MGASESPRVALVGCGNWGRNLARNLYQLGRLGWVCDPDAAALKQVRAAWPGVRTTRSFDQLIKERSVRTVAIAAPAARHHELARRALQSGRDVFVEKPLALSVAEAEELVQTARKRKRVLMVGHLLEYHPAVRKLKELVDAGELGEMLYVYSNRLNLGQVRTEENILWSFAPHDISVILRLLGSIPEWASTAGQHSLQRQVADVTMTCLGFPGKTRAHIFVSWLHPFKEQRLVVIGSKKMAVFDDVTKEGKLKLYDKGVEWQAGTPVLRQTAESTLFFPETEPLKEEIAHFLECVRTRREPLTGGENGVRVLRVLEACQRSMDAGGAPVPIGGKKP